MPDDSSIKERSITKYWDQISFVLQNYLFLAATNEGDWKFQIFEGVQTLNSVDLPLNSKFTIEAPESRFHINKNIFFDNIVILRSSSFWGKLSEIE